MAVSSPPFLGGAGGGCLAPSGLRLRISNAFTIFRTLMVRRPATARVDLLIFFPFFFVFLILIIKIALRFHRFKSGRFRKGRPFFLAKSFPTREHLIFRTRLPQDFYRFIRSVLPSDPISFLSEPRGDSMLLDIAKQLRGNSLCT